MSIKDSAESGARAYHEMHRGCIEELDAAHKRIAALEAERENFKAVLRKMKRFLDQDKPSINAWCGMLKDVCAALANFHDHGEVK